MLPFAYLIFDGPGDPAVQLQKCVFVSFAAVSTIWMLRRKKQFVVLGSFGALLSAVVIAAEVLHPLTRLSMVEDFGMSYVIAIFVSAAFPFVTIAAIHLSQKGEANQPVQTRPTSRPV